MGRGHRDASRLVLALMAASACADEACPEGHDQVGDRCIEREGQDGGTPPDAAPDAETCEPMTFYRDSDGDGHGTSDDSVTACEAPGSYVESSGDCDDGDDSVHPDANEMCNRVDEDCDGFSDEGLPLVAHYADVDGDGYGDAATEAMGCAVPADRTAEAGDCSDADETVYSGATERCGGVDEDCDGRVDEGLLGAPLDPFDIVDGRVGPSALASTGSSFVVGWVESSTPYYTVLVPPGFRATGSIWPLADVTNALAPGAAVVGGRAVLAWRDPDQIDAVFPPIGEDPSDPPLLVRRGFFSVVDREVRVHRVGDKGFVVYRTAEEVGGQLVNPTTGTVVGDALDLFSEESTDVAIYSIGTAIVGTDPPVAVVAFIDRRFGDPVRSVYVVMVTFDPSPSVSEPLRVRLPNEMPAVRAQPVALGGDGSANVALAVHAANSAGIKLFVLPARVEPGGSFGLLGETVTVDPPAIPAASTRTANGGDVLLALPDSSGEQEALWYLELDPEGAPVLTPREVVASRPMGQVSLARNDHGRGVIVFNSRGGPARVFVQPLECIER